MRWPAFTRALLGCAAVLPYLNCLGNQFVFDDNFLVAKHPALVAPVRSRRRSGAKPFA